MGGTTLMWVTAGGPCVLVRVFYERMSRVAPIRQQRDSLLCLLMAWHSVPISKRRKVTIGVPCSSYRLASSYEIEGSAKWLLGAEGMRLRI